MATEREPRYIGVSIDELLEYGEADLKQFDELSVDSEVRNGYKQFLSALRNQRTRMSTYFFVYSKFIVLKLEF